MVNAFANEPQELQPLLDMAAVLDARQVNIIGGVMPIRALDAVPLLRDGLALAAQYDFPVLLETHCDNMLKDLFYTLELLDALPELRLYADLSHFVVDREFRLPLSARDEGYIDRILARSDSPGPHRRPRADSVANRFSPAPAMGGTVPPLVEAGHTPVAPAQRQRCHPAFPV
jgi:hypothetical protein